jgi:hypothetical protein
MKWKHEVHSLGHNLMQTRSIQANSDGLKRYHFRLIDVPEFLLRLGVISIGHILRRNCLLQRVIAGKIKGGIEVTGRRGRRRRKLLDVVKERREYFHLKEEALDRTMWRARFGKGFGPVVRQTTK